MDNIDAIIQEIRRDHRNLSAEARAAVESNATVRAEYEAMSAIEKGIQTMPMRPVPLRLKTLVFERILQPAYNFWHLGIAVVLLALSPIMLQSLLRQTDAILMDRAALIGIYALYGVLTSLLILPLSFALFQQYKDKIENFKDSLDAYLENSPRNIFRR